MTNQQILEKAIQKAIDGGWNPLGFKDGLDKRYSGIRVLSLDYYDSGILMFYEIGEGTTIMRGDVRLGESDYDIIYDHDFAKAIWGSEDEYTFKDNNPKLPIIKYPWWKYHLQQMVISENPIKYLGEHLYD